VSRRRKLEDEELVLVEDFDAPAPAVIREMIDTLRPRCPVCGKRCSAVMAVLQHTVHAHHKPEQIEKVAAWWVDQAKKEAQR
jgi:hypothetical protein